MESELTVFRPQCATAASIQPHSVLRFEVKKQYSRLEWIRVSWRIRLGPGSNKRSDCRGVWNDDYPEHRVDGATNLTRQVRRWLHLRYFVYGI
jgi:hypothetical protein